MVSEFASLTNSQVVLMLLIWRPHLENHYCRKLFYKYNAILEKVVLSDPKSNRTKRVIFSFLPGMTSIGSESFLLFCFFFHLSHPEMTQKTTHSHQRKWSYDEV